MGVEQVLRKRYWRGITSSGLSSRRPFSGFGGSRSLYLFTRGVLALILDSSDALHGLVGLLAVERVAHLQVPLETSVEVGGRRVAHVGRHLLTGLLLESGRQLACRCVLTGGHVPLGPPGSVQPDGRAQLKVFGLRLPLLADADRREALMEEALVELAERDAGGAKTDDVHVGQEVGLDDGLVDLAQGGLHV